jgi:predicted RNA binding protein YcfA (HicA-like mRNA interferase family)
MSSIRPLPYREVIKKLRKLGFVFRRATGGTHEIWWNEQKRKTCVVPHHKEVKRGTLKSILKQAGISEETFLKAA